MSAPATPAVRHLDAPFTEAAVRALRAGDRVTLSGLIHTGRDRLHKFLYEGGASPVPLRDGAIYHCGPIVLPAPEGGWRVVSAGPTTSCREDAYMPRIIAAHGVRLILGKGGMNAATQVACREQGCAYLQLVGGAAAYLARCVRAVRGVWFLDEFGATEALWRLEVADLPAIVGIDTTGNSLYETIGRQSRARLDELLRQARRGHES